MLGDAGALHVFEVETLMVPCHTAFQMHSSGYGLAGIGWSSWEGQDKVRRLWFDVHAACKQHSMVLH